jgi:hypothetical protein
VCYPKIKIYVQECKKRKWITTLNLTQVKIFVTRFTLIELWDYRLPSEPVIKTVSLKIVHRTKLPVWNYLLLPEPVVELVVFLSTTVPLINKVCFGCVSFVSTYTSLLKPPARFVSYLTSIVADFPG